MLDVEGFILVGGASSRMGEEKSRLTFDGPTGVARIADSLLPLTDKVRIVGSRLEEQRLLANVPDLHPQWGPLGGIHAALTACKTDWCIVVACDLPFVTTELFERLLTLREKSEAVVPVQSDARPQPLCGVYKIRPCLNATERSIARDEHSPRALLDKVRARYVKFDEISDLSDSEHFFFNVNTPENYAEAQQIARQLQNRSR